jgi:hypothetical protein
VVYDAKRSLKKVFHAWTYYGPEVGLCSCLFKFAWVTYPVVPEVTYAAMGRARRMVSSFMHDFMHAFKQEINNDHHRISSKVAQTTADDYYDYQSNQVYPTRGPALQPFRRVGTHASNLPENVPLIEKTVNPDLLNVVDMLKHLQPKANATEFGIRLARHLKSQPRKLNSAQQFRFVNDDGDDIRNVHNETNATESRAFNGNYPQRGPQPLGPPPIGLQPLRQQQLGPQPLGHQPFGPQPIDRTFSSHGAPHGLPTLNNLPPADYTYYKHGTYHHVHDLRKNKGSYPPKEHHGHSHKGGWLAFDFEDAIMQALGLARPGRASLPSIAKCSKIYVFQAILRFFQKTLVGL